jgi:hypothetical protein
MLPGLEVPQVCHSLVGGVADNVRIVFKRLDTEQPVVVGGLILRWDTQPLVIRVE